MGMHSGVHKLVPSTLHERHAAIPSSGMPCMLPYQQPTNESV